MIEILDSDRTLLGDAGLDLDDETYVQVFAGIGMSRTSWPQRSLQDQWALYWTTYNFELLFDRYDNLLRNVDILRFRDTWLESLHDFDERRVIIDPKDFSPHFLSRRPSPDKVLRLLNHPATGTESAFVRMFAPQADLKWQWPIRISALEEDLEPLGLNELAQIWPANSLSELHPLSRSDARSEMLILPGGIRKALSKILHLPHRVRTGHLMVLSAQDEPWWEMARHIDSLAYETQAGAISLIYLPTTTPITDLINNYVRELSHNEPYDFALSHAFPRESSVHILDPKLSKFASLNVIAGNLGRRLQALPADSKLNFTLDPLSRMGLPREGELSPARLGAQLQANAFNLLVDQESQSGLGLRDISNVVRDARHDAAKDEIPRFMQGNLAKFSEGQWHRGVRSLVLGKFYRLEVFIGASVSGEIIADHAFFEREFYWSERSSYTLQILFADLNQWDEPLQGTMELPHQGDSSKCEFLFRPTRIGPFQGRVTVYYRGRILQTALLKMVVVQSEIEEAEEHGVDLLFEVETDLRRSLGTLEERRRFDACMILNHTAEGTPTMTAAGTNGAYIVSLEDVEHQLSKINTLLNQVALNKKKYGAGLTSPANTELLRDLAYEGNYLYRSLVLDNIYRSSAAQSLHESEYLQIVSAKPDALVPLEFVYEFPPPTEDGQVCKNAKKALIAGRCFADCKPTTSPAPHVCPLGFWGLSKVIEREIHDPSLPKAAHIRSEPIGNRKILSLNGVGLLATSNQVPVREANLLSKTMNSGWNNKVASVRTWKDWKSEVSKQSPVLLVALPHADGAGSDISLEISGDVLKSLFIDKNYVRASPDGPPPVVLLLGCDVVNVAYGESYARHVAIFRQADAALVLGTIATILGVDAAKVAGRLIERLADKTHRSQDCFGEILRQVKREAVADGLMMALSLVAFGDADWRLE